ncbi:MAG: hypothetical protein JKY61_13075 [Planctomycetes bacterium]|nr:hypothetical protein [Planctomycetota bacterium]
MLILGFGVPLACKAAHLVLQFIQRRKSLYALTRCTWFTYHISRENYLPVFRRETWKIGLSLFGLKVTTSDGQRTALVYTGRASFDSGYTLLTLTGKKHMEQIQYQFLTPIPGEDTLTVGFHLSKDFDGKLFVTPKLICEIERTDEEAKNILSSAVIWFEKETSLRLLETPILPAGTRD